MNVSKQHREDLLNKIQQIRTYIATAPQDANTGNLLLYLDELTKDVKGKKYGLVFEQHREQIDEILDTHTPVLTEEKDLFIDNGGEMNFLIEGDNLAALKLLEKTHKGKIDVIYIDPPYNTENSLTYDDKRIGLDDNYRHSKWISFIRERLILAKQLLSSDGIILASIDDNEAYQLKLIFDEVFSENNCMGIFAVIKAEGGGMAKYIVKGHDLLIVFAKDLSKAKPLAKEKDIRGKHITIDNVEYWIQEDAIRETFGQYGNLFYEDVEEKRGLEYKEQIDNGIRNNEYILVEKDNGKHVIGKLRRIDEDYSKFYSVLKHLNSEGVSTLSSMGLENDFDYPKPVSLIKEIVKGATFLKHRKTIILDFFAGSGTTAQAVLELNKEDGKHRNFILCTNNEVSARHKLMFVQKFGLLREYNPNKQTTENAIERTIFNCFPNGKEGFDDLVQNNKELYNSLGICRYVTYKRIQNVINGYISKNKESKVLYEKKITKDNYEHGSEYAEHIQEIMRENPQLSYNVRINKDCKLQLTAETNEHFHYEGCSASLKYYKIDFVPISDKMYYEYADELLLHIRELVELENGINFNGNAGIAIVLTDEEMETFVNQKDNKTKVLYRGHDVLLDAKQEAYLRDNGIKVNVIPDYYYNELNR